MSVPEQNATPTLQMRHNRLSYMDVKKPTAAGYSLMGEGFTNLAESKNPKEYTRQYIHQKTEKTDVIGYSPSLAYSCDVVKGDPVVDDIKYITDHELLGEDTHRDVVTYDEADAVTGQTAPTFKAYKRTYAIVPDSSADGTEALVITGNFKAVSDIIYGQFVPSTKTFTADGDDDGDDDNEENGAQG